MAVESRFGLPTPGSTATPDVEQHAQDEGGGEDDEDTSSVRFSWLP